jgi:DNA-binding transcriptional regulator YiaG
MNTFKHRSKPEKEPYRYTMSGLDDIYLCGGYDRVKTDYGDGVVVHHMDDLHRAIGLYLTESKKTLNGKEIRFLRHQMDLTQAHLGDVLRVTDQTVARWEKDEVTIPGPEDLLLRLVYLGHESKTVDVRSLADTLRASDEAASDKAVFTPTDDGDGWKLAA